MRIEKKLTLAHIRLNKKRTVLTILGIIISVAMIVSVFIGIASFMSYKENVVISTNSSAHFHIIDVNSRELDILKNDDRVKSVGLNEYGRADTSGVRVDGAKSLRHSTAYINWYDSEMFNQLYIEDMAGTFPTNNKEILINQEYIDQNGFGWKIGDTITLQTGRRHSETEEDVFHITYTGQYQYGEIFDFYENRNFKIVGIIKDKLLDYQINQMYSVCDENSVYSANVQLNKVTPFTMHTINDIAKKAGH